MVLLDDVVEVFDLTDLDPCLMFGIVAFNRRRIGAALVDRDRLRRSIPADRLAQEPQRGFAIPFGGQQEIHRGAGLPAQDRHDTRFIFHQSHPMS
jgi:hypothetical protein